MQKLAILQFGSPNWMQFIANAKFFYSIRKLFSYKQFIVFQFHTALCNISHVAKYSIYIISSKYSTYKVFLYIIRVYLVVLYRNIIPNKSYECDTNQTSMHRLCHRYIPNWKDFILGMQKHTGYEHIHMFIILFNP